MVQGSGVILGLFAAAVLLPATIVALAYLAVWADERDREDCDR